MDENSVLYKKAASDYFSGETYYWEKLYTQENLYTYFLETLMRRRKQLIMEYVNSFAKGKSLTILDVGCGTGIYLQELLRNGHIVYGIDLSTKMLQSTLNNIPLEFKQKSFINLADAEYLPFKSQKFDLIIAAGVLEYLPNDKNAIKEFERILKKEGSVVFTLPNILKLNNLLDPYYYIIRIIKFIEIHFKKNPEKKIDPQEFGYNDSFTVKRYFKSQINNLIENTNLKTFNIMGIGYGPLTIWKKEILSDKLIIKLSNLLEKSSKIFPLKFIDLFASRWIIIVIKIK